VEIGLNGDATGSRARARLWPDDN